MKRYALLFALAFTLFGCSKDEDTEPEFTVGPEQLNFIHNGSEKTWRVAQIFSEYSRSRLDEMKPCIIDDTYTFFANSSTVRMNMGEVSCFYEEPESQATELTFTHYPEEGTAYLDHGRHEAKDRQSSAILYILKLREVSENRLLFANGNEGNWSRVLILEAVD